MYKELNVKAGDTVLYYHSWAGRRSLPAITKVIRVTPTGRIKVALYPSEQFNKYGKRMGDNLWGTSYLEVPTAEKLQEVKEKTFVRRLVQTLHDAVTEDNISYEQAVAIYKILEGGGSDED